MIQKSGRPRALIALPTAIVLILLSAGVPLLDAGGPPGWDGGAEHSAPGQVDHDHTLCLQYGATAWSPAPPTANPPVSEVRELACPGGARLHSELLLRSTHHSRAPPRV